MLRCGAGEVERDLVAGDGDRGADHEVALGRLEHILRLETPVGQAGDRGSDDALRVVEELVHRRDDAVSVPALARARRGAASASAWAASWARKSPRRSSGLRILATRPSSSSSSSRVGGITTPSSASVREPAGMLPGSDAADVGVVRAADREADVGPGDERDVG